MNILLLSRPKNTGLPINIKHLTRMWALWHNRSKKRNHLHSRKLGVKFRSWTSPSALLNTKMLLHPPPFRGSSNPWSPVCHKRYLWNLQWGNFDTFSHPRLMLNPKFYCVPLVCKDSMHEKGGIQTTIRGKVACNGTSDVLKSAICCSYTHTARADAHPPHKKRFFSSTSCTRHVDARGPLFLIFSEKEYEGE